MKVIPTRANGPRKKGLIPGEEGPALGELKKGSVAAAQKAEEKDYTQRGGW